MNRFSFLQSVLGMALLVLGDAARAVDEPRGVEGTSAKTTIGTVEAKKSASAVEAKDNEEENKVGDEDATAARRIASVNEMSGTATVEKGENYETTVTVRKPVTAATASTVRDRDLRLRPMRRPADILQLTPGLFVVQHAGGGKANQYFLRGFDSDHGTDVALSVDGIPVNLPSHGHGQGWADMHWLLPEVVESVEVLKGPYFSHLGDFATAGSININTKNRSPFSKASMTAGSFGTGRLMALASGPKSEFSPIIAAEGYYTNGPFILPEATRRFNVFTKFTKEFSSTKALTVGATGYGGEWRASGQIPQREVNAGRLDRFGNLDPTEGGDSNRYGAFAHYRQDTSATDQLKVSGYATYTRLNIFSNFTFFSGNPVNGDQINQTDNRMTYGVNGSYRFLKKLDGIPFETTVGLQGRADNITNGLFNSVRRSRLGTVNSNDIRLQNIGLYANEEVTLTPWFRTVAGLRGDHYTFGLTDRVAAADRGTRSATLVSPKLNLIFTVAPRTDVFVNYGLGFHSNDARGVFDPAAPATPLTRYAAYEVGSRTRIGDRLDVGAALFTSFSDNELVYVGDAGGTELKGPARRIGAEVEARLKVTDWLYADTDLNFVQARLRQAPSGADAVPYAPTRLLSGGLSAEHPEGYFGRVGFTHIGDRPATEDRFLVAEGFLRFDASVGYRRKTFEVALAVQNIFNTTWREAQFATVSKLPSETGPASCPAGTRPGTDASGGFAGCEDVHFTPGAPLNVQATASVYF